MENHSEHHVYLEGEPVAELLDQTEYPSNIGKVVAISDRQICFLRRDRHELTHFKLEYFEMRDCRAIEYQKETAYYRILVGILSFIAVAICMFMLVTNLESYTTEGAPLIIASVALASFGVRFITSTHRHILRFEMPDETLIWRSPAIDFKSKAGAAHAVRKFARERGILREAEQ